MTPGFVFDLDRCAGCQACVIACTIENRAEQGINWRQVYTFNARNHPDLPLFHLSLACHHCAEPACLEACPTLAYSVDPRTGAVILDPGKCMGCKYCTWACPYDAPRYNAAKGTTEKCHFCYWRLQEGLRPACVSACPLGALQIEERRSGEAENLDRVPGFTEAGLKPGLRLIPRTRGNLAPQMTAPPGQDAIGSLFLRSRQIPGKKITLKGEWALLLFTTIAYLLVAFFTASLISHRELDPFIFLGVGAVGMAVTAHHLGRKTRAVRAIFNVRRSPLSREIVFFSIFLGLAALFLLFFPGVPLLGWLAAGVGFINLYTIDRIYQVAMKTGPGNFHSAQVLFTGFFLTGILVKNAWLMGIFGLIKLFLYLFRKYYFLKTGQKTRPLISVLRIISGFGAPLVLLIAKDPLLPGAFGLAATMGVLIGELIDRAEYYGELDVITPEKQILADLLRLLSLSRYAHP